METNLLVSIIINNYNYDRFLSQEIDSALAQTYPNLEVIDDDGSTDNSREIIAACSDRSHHQQNLYDRSGRGKHPVT